MTTLLAHEWLSPIGGSENVFEQIRETFPGARAVCLWNDATERFPHGVEETWLAHTPLRRSKPLAMPFLSRTWNSVDLAGVDRVIASTHAFSHHLAARSVARGIPSFAYVHSPARYVWAPEHDDRGQSPIARIGRGYFKRLDRSRTSSEVSYASNSEFVRQRIGYAWGVDARVIYPPVNVEQIQSVVDWRSQVVDLNELRQLDFLPPEFVLGASRLVEYKRIESAIVAGEALGMPVVIVGQGPDEPRLRSLAEKSAVPVMFFGSASTPTLYSLLQMASLFTFMAVEDFGILPVESMALGTPVVVNELGGAKESVDRIGLGRAIPLEEVRNVAPLIVGAKRPPASRIAEAFGVQAFRQRVAAWAALTSGSAA